MTELIDHPGQNDVLSGRGGATNNHVGNKRFRALVSDHQPAYLNSAKRDKRYVALTIVDIVTSRGGRFLKKVDDGTGRGGWYDVGPKKAAAKTSQALREGLHDHRSLAATGVVPPHPQRAERRGSSDGGGAGTSSSADDDGGHQPPRKRRRIDDGPASLAASPVLVSEVDAPECPIFSLGFGLGGEEEIYSNAAVVFEASPPPSAEDVGEIVAL